MPKSRKKKVANTKALVHEAVDRVFILAQQPDLITNGYTHKGFNNKAKMIMRNIETELHNLYQYLGRRL